MSLDNFVKQAVQKATGYKDIKTSDITNEQKRKKRERKKEKIVANVCSDNPSASWRDIEVKKSNFSKFSKKDIEDWTPKDFVYFTQKKYIDKFDNYSGLQNVAMALEVNRLFDDMDDVFGETSNIMMRDYIVFFFKNYIDFFVSKDGFYFSQLRKKDILNNFYKEYNHKEALKKSKKNVESVNNLCNNLNKDDIEGAFLLGINNLLLEYGIIISVNWLIKKGIDKNISIDTIFKCFTQSNNNDKKVIIKKTEQFSPYPVYLKFKEISRFCSKLNIMFLDNEVIINMFKDCEVK